MSSPIISLNIDSYRYPGTDVDVLHDIHLDIEAGEYVAIIGLNGAGKTTLGLTLNGVIPTMLSGTMNGTVLVSGMNVVEYPVREMSKIVGMVFDNPEFQMSQQSVAEEVALGLENQGVPFERMREIIPRTLEQVGLAGFEDRSPLGLSGGQQQRLAIAAVLAMDPQILIMDEPTSNLDPIGKREVFDIAAQLNKQRGMTVIVIEHEVEVLAQFADRVIVVHEGTVIMNDTPANVLSRVDELRALGLRAPEVAAVAHDLAAAGLWTDAIPTTLEPAIAGVRRLIGDDND